MVQRRGLLPLWLWVAFGWALFVAVIPAYAATFTVNSILDDADAVPGDGTCATLQSVCTLRAAIEEANALAGADAINLPAGVYLLKAGELAITDDLTLLGAGPSITTIRNVGAARVMSVASGKTVTIDGVRVQGGKAELGAGLLNDGTVTLTNDIFAGNHAVGDVFGLGAGINNSGTAILSNVTFKGNRARGSGGGFGGAIYTTGTVTASDVTFTANVTNGCGAAVYNVGGAVTLTRCSILSNQVSNSGGGIFNQLGTVDLSASTLAHNGATQAGGGIFTYAPMTLTNVTITGNHAGIGGGLLSGLNSTVTLANVTLSSNRAPQGAGLYADSASVSLHNTLVALNRPANCAGSSAVTSLGYNLDSGHTCSLTAAGDLSDANPKLGALHNNGGPTKTCALLPGSAAINAGDNNGCPTTDQCGEPRPAGTPAICDIGAFEVQP